MKDYTYMIVRQEMAGEDYEEKVRRGSGDYFVGPVEVIAVAVNKDGLTEEQAKQVRFAYEFLLTLGNSEQPHAFFDAFQTTLSIPKADSPLIVVDVEEYLSQYSAEELSEAYRKVVAERRREENAEIVVRYKWTGVWAVPKRGQWFMALGGEPTDCIWDDFEEKRWILTRIVEGETNE